MGAALTLIQGEATDVPHSTFGEVVTWAYDGDIYLLAVCDKFWLATGVWNLDDDFHGNWVYASVGRTLASEYMDHTLMFESLRDCKKWIEQNQLPDDHAAGKWMPLNFGDDIRYDRFMAGRMGRDNLEFKPRFKTSMRAIEAKRAVVKHKG